MPARLTVVGTGIQSGRDLSPVALHHIRNADMVLTAVADQVTACWLRELNKKTESLTVFYSPKKTRLQTYEEMTDRIMSFVEDGRDVCVVVYGHPGVCAYATHKAIGRARARGVEAFMIPAVSSVDCLIADLGIDPVMPGLAVYDATHLLLHRDCFNADTGLVLLQIAITGERGSQRSKGFGRAGLRALVGKLLPVYGKHHEVIIYEASPYLIGKPIVKRIALRDVPLAPLSPTSTLYVPPRGPSRKDKEMLRRFAGK